jgi:hypothetical protein
MNNDFTLVVNWLVQNLKEDKHVSQAFLIGSFLHKDFILIGDVDLVQVINYNDINILNEQIQITKRIKKKFEFEFNKVLHITSFTQNESRDFQQFMSRNKFILIK